MRRTLLVPLEGLPLAETALPVASLMANLLGAELDLVHVLPAEAPGMDESHARDYLERIASGMAWRSQPQVHVMLGSVAESMAV